MKTYEVAIVGVPPGLLMHRFSPEDEAALVALVQKRSGKKPTNEEYAECAAYRLESGELCQPAEHIYQAMCKAASAFRIKGQGKKTYKSAVKGNILISPEYISHGRKDYEIDLRPVRIGNARIMRARPLLREWRLSFMIGVIDDDDVPGEIVQAVLVEAGQKIGIGDYRPRYGRFIVESFKAAD